jgi:hypothetical protein
VNKAPYQGYRNDGISRIEIFEEFKGGLQDGVDERSVVKLGWLEGKLGKERN